MTLRGISRASFLQIFSLIRPSYITAATELALLRTDILSSGDVDWLEGSMEHQDLDLSSTVSNPEAFQDNLNSLYGAHYATMFTNLSMHSPEYQLRLKLAVYDALGQYGRVDIRVWETSPQMIERREREFLLYGDGLGQSIDAII